MRYDAFFSGFRAADTGIAPSVLRSAFPVQTRFSPSLPSPPPFPQKNFSALPSEIKPFTSFHRKNSKKSPGNIWRESSKAVILSPLSQRKAEAIRRYLKGFHKQTVQYKSGRPAAAAMPHGASG
jgi:hypothetical protein